MFFKNMIQYSNTTYELLAHMIFHISVENNYKSYLSFFGEPEVNRADLSCICSLREN